jgi:predicted metal-binding protein
MSTTIFVCDTCRYSREHREGPDGRTGGEMLAERVERLAAGRPGIEVRRQSCLMGCDRFCNTAVAAPGKLTYVLGMFAPTEASAEAVVEYARLHAESPTGQVPLRQWPQGVKGHFVARIPATAPAPSPALAPAPGLPVGRA